MKKKFRTMGFCFLLAVLIRFGLLCLEQPAQQPGREHWQVIFGDIHRQVRNVADREKAAAYLQEKTPVFAAIVRNALHTVQNLEPGYLGQDLKEQAEKIFYPDE